MSALRAAARDLLAALAADFTPAIVSATQAVRAAIAAPPRMSSAETSSRALAALLATADSACGPTVAGCVRVALRAHLARAPGLGVPVLRHAIDAGRVAPAARFPDGSGHVPAAEVL